MCITWRHLYGATNIIVNRYTYYFSKFLELSETIHIFAT